MNKYIKSIIWLVIIVLVVWFLRPFFHPLLMGFVVSPLSAILIIAIVVGVISMGRSLQKLRFEKVSATNFALRTSQGFSWKSFVLYAVVLVVLIVLISLEGSARYLMTAKQTDFATRTDLPAFEPIRLVPKQVATRYADDSFQSPQEQLGDSQIVKVDGELKRVFPRLPDGWLLYFTKKMGGFVTVDVDTLDRKVAIENTQFKYSEGVGIFDNLYYRLSLKKYFVTYSSEPIYVKDDSGSWVTVVPYMKYKGFPFTVPYWGGVMIVKPDGTLTDYTPEQAQSLSYLAGNRIYPKELTLFYANSYAYKNGILNNWFLHKDQTEVVSLPGDEPILHVTTSEGFKQMVVTEPYGRSYGIYKIFLFDATSGKREIISYDINSQLTGPVVAADYIKREFPSYNWSSFVLSEPRPVKVKGDLNWMLSIIPDDAAGIAKTVMLDAKTNKVTSFDTVAQLSELLKTGAVAETTPTTNATLDRAAIRAKIDALQQQLDDLKTLVK